MKKKLVDLTEEDIASICEGRRCDGCVLDIPESSVCYKIVLRRFKDVEVEIEEMYRMP